MTGTKSMFEGILSEIFVYMVLAGIGGVGSFCAVVYRCVHKQAKRGYRQSQAILILTKSIENQTLMYHKEYRGGLYDEAEITLKDEDGNF